jgi:hypothetical protein
VGIIAELKRQIGELEAALAEHLRHFIGEQEILQSGIQLR